MPSLVFATHKIPKGTIKQWKDLIANIPQGWQICDGTNGTPDLRSKFPRGAPASTEAGTTGGADDVTLDTTMIPSHNHTITDPTHNHGFSGQFKEGIFSGGAYSSASQTSSSVAATISLNNEGGGGSHNNKPAYYEVIFIMKMDDS